MIIRSKETSWPADWMTEIEHRLSGQKSEILPRLMRDEDPADIFVDIAARYANIADELRAGVTELLSKWSDGTQFRATRALVLSELCYLAARLGAHEALPSLLILVEDTTATTLVAPGEDLRLRALRALVGLLGGISLDAAAQYRPLLVRLLDEPRLATVALIGLVGLWPEETDLFEAGLSPGAQGGDLLSVGVDVMFVDRG